jgi:pilus assembly protein CpaB
MIMRNIRILNVGTFPVYNQEGEEVTLATPTPSGEEPAEGEEPVPIGKPIGEPPDIVTLVVLPQQAVTLNYLIYTGAEITLALRSAGDDTETLTNAVTLQYLMDEYQIPPPVRLPYGTVPRIDELKSPTLENDITGDEVIQ